MIDESVLNANEYWEVPLSYYSSSNAMAEAALQRPDFWLRKHQTVISYPIDTTKWVVFNADAACESKLCVHCIISWQNLDYYVVSVLLVYYRTVYDNTLFRMLVDQLDSAADGFRQIRIDNRAILIDDYFKSALEGWDYIWIMEQY